MVVESVAPEDLDVDGLVDEVRLVGNHDAHAPVAVFESGQRAGAGFVACEFGEVFEEEAGGSVEGGGEGEPCGFWDASGEIGWVAEMG